MSTNNTSSPLVPSPPLDDSSAIHFEDPGVSNGDVDWLFRGKAVKKLSKKTNIINVEVQSQLRQAQQKTRIASMPSVLPSSLPQVNAPIHQPVKAQLPLKPSLKVSTPPPPISVPPHPKHHHSVLHHHKSKATEEPLSSPPSTVPAPIPINVPIPAANTSKPRSTSFTKKVSRSMSDSKDKSPLSLKSPLTPKKSLFSSLSSKLKSKSVQQTSAPTHANHKGSTYVAPIPIQQAPDQKPRPLSKI
ncbi:unnamed protein product [Ambrosiozyma monospora]|uniref:Unnamed protein product n=1 Tax=Ambrosiozyma monospora TaxID=43982 RepID=A0A9W6Z3G5_AMBMO|nr:unnamed protein product [Ambrosiozyma monospora]